MGEAPTRARDSGVSRDERTQGDPKQKRVPRKPERAAPVPASTFSQGARRQEPVPAEPV